MSRRSVVAAAVGVFLCFLVYWGSLKWGGLTSSTEPEFFDVDTSGNLVFSLRDVIYWQGAKDREARKLIDGREVAFLPGGTAFLFENEDRIWRYDLQQKRAIPVTTPTAEQMDWYPAWCNALQRVVFARAEQRRLAGTAGASYDVYSCNLDGSGVRRLTHEEFYQVLISPQSSFDGDLFFVGDSFESGPPNPDSVYRLDLATNALERLNRFDGVSGISISHDGKKLLIGKGPGYYSIILCDARSDGSQVLMKPREGFISSPALFAAGDREIYFLHDADRSGDAAIYRMRIADGSRTLVGGRK